MAYILNIETATKNCSVTIAHDGAILSSIEVADQGYSHAEKLHVFFEEALKEAGITFQDLNAVGVSQGPGSYTGLRIGVSAAKGLCYALGIPLIATDTLEALSRKISVNHGIIIPMIDARRMEAFTAIFSRDYEKIRETQAEIIDQTTYSECSETIHLIGDGASKCKEVLTSDKFVYHDEVIYPSAREMALMSFEKYKKSDFVDVAYFEPFYLKDFVMTTKPKA
ncbi:tRNA (adenosine(37)-N6)-threonylcarbamoyltransferase complex dimerization subunit type 1 TsaB [Flavobacterium sp. SM15]|uniref:tRNA (adenosine(37)-N6)-threonylcarbamoyltransferase complex dimerization subunit type 1 TsaB n=1 Tax=Flavobacterium sp. SM15 TaxID=2908005 RepID=UPI001EDC2500|nr:tRNA (adenosine(37)-N6)-threonylcarbamoyltransferase complex dimerization subunit type 1 TsaB [Flavobacterium sp. SM15]MCG2610809.1 tRNA (adenosine(37)-N6)-threonylcarbamoyltransferase complex dimerization subunit type 1 TsaB [Flavobacterium sp. SM15]